MHKLFKRAFSEYVMMLWNKLKVKRVHIKNDSDFIPQSHKESLFKMDTGEKQEDACRAGELTSCVW